MPILELLDIIDIILLHICVVVFNTTTQALSIGCTGVK